MPWERCQSNLPVPNQAEPDQPHSFSLLYRRDHHLPTSTNPHLLPNLHPFTTSSPGSNISMPPTTQSRRFPPLPTSMQSSAVSLYLSCRVRAYSDRTRPTILCEEPSRYSTWLPPRTARKRQATRKRNMGDPPVHQSELITWFEQETGRKLSHSQISKISPWRWRVEHRDSADTKQVQSQLEAKRASAGDRPEPLGSFVK